jgi:hypothetical protein
MRIRRGGVDEGGYKRRKSRWPRRGRLRLGWAHARARHPAVMKQELDLERGGGVSEYYEADQNMSNSRRSRAYGWRWTRGYEMYVECSSWSSEPCGNVSKVCGPTKV